ncbi:MAG TPA: GNAT family N-acetyltransferase [Candidatus Avibacteroides faecavium]|nr:GNAT family N-acetyltransferase [Candidatus Avibacteroides faecavium]
MRVRQVGEGRRRWLPLLLMADEQESMVARYLDRGEMFVMEDCCGEAAVVAVVTMEGEGVCELKNLAVAPHLRRRGLGRAMVEWLCGHYAACCSRMLVGTGDVPGTTGFYEACGFVYSHRVEGFFTKNYDHAIVEEGRLLDDMVCYCRDLRG